MKRLLAACGAAVLFSALSQIALPQAAMAQSPGPYVSGAAGLSLMRDHKLEGGTIDTTAEFDPGFALSGAVGTALENGFRPELEFNYHRSAVDQVGNVDATGHTSGIGLMLNGFYDFKNGTPWTPYLGAGIGTVRVSGDSVSPVSTTRVDDSDWGFGYQGIAGVTYQMNPQTGLFAEYRYVGTSGISLVTDTGTHLDADGGEHRIMVGLRWSFGAPKPMPVAEPMPVKEPAPAPAPKAEPAPAPAPAPTVVKRYLVFFDFDKSNLTTDAKTIVSQAAANSKTANVTRIIATGHADRSGSDAYNLKLSKKRAEAVKAELKRQGIPASEVTVLWKGEREPLVQTPDGVREPQNRRVEIVFQ